MEEAPAASFSSSNLHVACSSALSHRVQLLKKNILLSAALYHVCYLAALLLKKDGGQPFTEAGSLGVPEATPS
jgi:hypothetical protein